MSNPFQHILVPVDLSSCSAAALTLASQLAKVHGSRLAVLHVNDASPGSALAIEAAVEDFVRSVLGEAPVPSIHVAGGTPRDAILSAVVRLACDAIVLGTHGRTGRAHMLVGSVAESVVRAASCPVVTVRERA
jgi:universal stress protein A